MENGIAYLLLLQKLLGEAQQQFKYDAAQQVEAQKVSICFQVRKVSGDGAITLLGIVTIDPGDQLLYRPDSRSTYAFLRLKLENLGVVLR